jgi:small GTP-binding protein
MANDNDLLQEFPEKTREQLRSIWDDLPEPLQLTLRGAVKLLPGDFKRWRMLLGMALSQFKIAAGQKHSVAIVGPANAGKSTLYNQFVREQKDRALVSPVPGTTRESQEADAGLFAVVDTPGADAVGEIGELEKDRALTAADKADFLVLVFDATQGIRKSEQELYREFVALEKPVVVVLNKIDLVRRDRDKVVATAAANLGLAMYQVIPISAKDGTNLERVMVAIAKTEPEMVAALGRALPEFRWKLAWTAITGAASTAAVIALTPLPIFDVIPLLAVQISMVLGIARIYKYEITWQRARELIVTFGLGFLGRTIFQELSKIGGPPGWLLSAAIAASTTAVMGYAAVLWFERGERLTSDSMKRVTQGVTQYLLESLRSLGKRKPGNKGLRDQMAAALDKSPLANVSAPSGPVSDSSAPAAPSGPLPDPKLP